MSMTRKEALQRIEFRVRHSCPDANGDNIGECDGCWRNPCNDMKAVMLLAQDRPHGEWKYKPMKGAFCSECGWHSIWNFNFCPECGADMREGEAK